MSLAYSDEELALALKLYQEGIPAYDIAVELGKPYHSVVGKLVGAGVYQTHTPTKRHTKESIFAELVAELGVDEERVTSLANATANALTIVLAAIREKSTGVKNELLDSLRKEMC